MKNEFLIEDYITYLSKQIHRALIMEVGVTPKPGLVDLDNSGSHRDMNFTSFRLSADALTPYFEDFMYGALSVENEHDLISRLRPIGLNAEKAMYDATGMINTHKGAIFNLGLITSSIVFLSNTMKKELAIEDLLRLRKTIKINALELQKDYSNLQGKMSSGIRIYHEYGIGSVREEAMAGYPSIFEVGLPYLLEIVSLPYDTNTKLIALLLKLMSVTQDSNIVKRGGVSALKYIQEKSQGLLKYLDNEEMFLKKVSEFDKECIKENLSPGGSADLLSCCIFLALIFKVI